MRSLPRDEARRATSSRRPLSRVVAACLLAVGLLAGVGAPSSAKEPRVDVSKRAASLPGPVYSWFPMPAVLPVESDARVRDPKFRSQLQAALDKALQAKGYRVAAAGAKPDFVMAYRVGMRDTSTPTVHESDTSVAPQAAMHCGSEGCSQIVTEGATGVPELKLGTASSVEGGLVVEALAPGTINVLWRARSRGEIKPGAISQARLDAVARHTLDQIPAATR